MKNAWAVQDAKNRFSEVVERAANDGPQIIKRRGKEVAVLISIQQFRKLAAPRGDLVSFLRSSPLAGEPLDLSRARDRGREIDL